MNYCKVKEKKVDDGFSIQLGLFDYINPILYSITMVTIIRSFYFSMGLPYNIILLIGALMSIIFGFSIPTYKVMIGLGITEFKLPISLVFCVNVGIFLSGLMMFKYIMNIDIFLLISIIIIIILSLLILYNKTKIINTIAILTGAFGYLMLYISLITYSIKQSIILPILFYSIAILLFIMLCGIGIKANLKDSKIHWIIEISNVICQFLVTIGTIVLFI